MKIEPISTTSDGLCHTLTVSLPDHCGMANVNVSGAAHFPCTAVLVVYEE